MMSLRFPRGAARTATSGPPPWLRFIQATNRVDKIFGNPISVGPEPGFTTVEEYADALVMFPEDDPITVRIIALTERGHAAMKAALDQYGYDVSPL